MLHALPKFEGQLRFEKDEEIVGCTLGEEMLSYQILSLV